MKQKYSTQAMATRYACFKSQMAGVAGNASARRLISGLMLAAIAISSGSHGAKAGTFSSTGSMKLGRITPGAVLLPNGKVLVVGGTSSPSASAELYDPVTGNWSFTGNMNTARSSAPAILLSNGKVLVAGGQGEQNATLSVAEIYDPATGMWSSTGSLNIPRITQAVLLSNGKVMMSGGSGNGGLSSCELYDRGTGKWTLTGDLITGRSAISLMLGNGRVLIAGGANNGNHLSSSELYDAGSGKWTAGTSLTVPRNAHTMTLLANGNILVAGGFNYNASRVPYSLSSAEIYNASTRAWSTTGEMSVERMVHSATLLKNGKVLVAGGYSWSSSPVRHTSAELYDSKTGTWTPTGNLNTGRNAHRGVLLQNGKVLILGGFDSANTFLSSAELYDSGDAGTPPPSATAKASYSGLFYSSGGVTHQSSGFISVATTSKGTFSAKLQHSGKTYSISGVFGDDRKSSVSILRKGISSMTLMLQIDPAGDQLTGTVSDGIWMSQLFADRAVYNAKTNPAPGGGKYTLVIPGNKSSIVEPGGDSVGTITIDAAGKARVAGILCDGTKVTQSAAISKQGQLPIFKSLYSGNGLAIGWLTFATGSISDISGRINWIKLPQTTSKFFPLGFNVSSETLGSFYVTPANGNRVLNFNGAQMRLEGGNLTAILDNPIMLGSNNKITDPSDSKSTVSLITSSGLAKGSFIHPATGKKTSITGVALQKQNIARGFFPGTNLIGAFSLDGN